MLCWLGSASKGQGQMRVLCGSNRLYYTFSDILQLNVPSLVFHWLLRPAQGFSVKHGLCAKYSVLEGTFDVLLLPVAQTLI